MEMVEIPVQLDVGFAKFGTEEMPLDQRMRIWAAISLYLDHKVSIGRAAQLAGMGYGVFHDYLGKHQIPISLLTFEEVLKDLEAIKTINEEG